MNKNMQLLIDEIATKVSRLPVPYTIIGSKSLPLDIQVYSLRYPICTSTQWRYQQNKYVIPAYSFVIFVPSVLYYESQLRGSINNIPVIMDRTNREMSDDSICFNLIVSSRKVTPIDHTFSIAPGTSIILIDKNII